MNASPTPNRTRLVAGFLLLGLIAGTSVAWAMGDDPVPIKPAGESKAKASGAKAVEAKPDATLCAKGMVPDAKTHKCVAKQSGILPDADLTSYAYALAKAERYQDALDVLDIVKDQNTPRAMNYRGYATRKLGRTEEGIGFYLKSVALDPAYLPVREYLGEAYVIQGKLDLANEQLAVIKTLCGGTACEEYVDLAEAIAKAKAS